MKSNNYRLSIQWKWGLFYLILILPAIQGDTCNCSNPSTQNSSTQYNPVICYTSDFGNTWDADTIRQNEFGSTSESYFENIVQLNGGIYCVTYKGSVWVSSDDFHSWTPGTQSDFHVNKLRVSLNTIYAAGYDANTFVGLIFKSTDGQQWSEVYRGTSAIVNYSAIDAYNMNIIALGDSVSTYSTNGGSTWFNSVIPLGHSINAGSIISDNKALCLGDSKIFFTSNGGAVWTYRNTVPSSNLEDADMESNRTGITLLTVDLHGISRTTDEGLNWTAVSSERIFKLAYNYNICAGAGFDIKKSTDNGSTWTTTSLIGILGRSIYFQDDGQFGYITSSAKVHQ